MKKIVFFVAGLLLISSFAAIGLGNEASSTQQMTLSFQQPVIKDSSVDNFIEIDVSGANARLHHAGEPLLPIYTETMTFPFGTKILDITCNPVGIQTMDINEKVVPTPEPMLLDGGYYEPEYIPEASVYDSNDLYPNSWFNIYTGGGLDENSEHKTFLTIQTYPARYNPGLDSITYASGFEIQISYQTPSSNLLPTSSQYELVIISPSKLYDNTLNDFIQHKNDMGVSTFIKTTEEIYSEYSGNDNAEKIKYFIKDALETYGIKYVLLVGGLDSLVYGVARDSTSLGDKDWHLPVRYNMMQYETGSTKDPGMITDLYYADIFDGEGAFQTWDTNGDGIYAKWAGFQGKDELDFWPDVYVGRLACRNVWEVKIMTNKIMTYETTAYGSSWANKMITFGGDSFHDSGTEYLEGEIVGDKILAEFMSEFTPVRVYASYKDSNPSYTPTSENIVREVSKGAGHLFFDGHANPGSWNTHWPGEEEWTGGIQNMAFMQFSNKDQYPILNVEGCHNSQFNISIISTLLDKDNSGKTWCYGFPTPECWSWWFARKINGGSLATIGNTGLGYGAVGEHGDLDGDGNNEPDCMEALGGYFFVNIYKTIDEGADTLGEVWGGGINKYMTIYPATEDQIDAKEMEQLCLLGDPSLKVGGYPPSASIRASIGGDSNGVPNEMLSFEAIGQPGNSGYTFKWDLDEDGNYNDYTGESVELPFEEPGVYEISVKASKNGQTVTYHRLVEIEKDQVPARPSITGPTSGKAGETKQYTITTTDPYEDELYYLIDWDDGTYDVKGPMDSGESCEISHRWTNTGSYQVKVTAFDSFAGQSEEGTLIVAMPKTKNSIGMPFIQRFLENHPILARLLELLILQNLI